MVIRLYLGLAELAHCVARAESEAVYSPVHLYKLILCLIHSLVLAEIALVLLASLVELQVLQKIPITVFLGWAAEQRILRLAPEHQLLELVPPVARWKNAVERLLAIGARSIFLNTFIDAFLAEYLLAGLFRLAFGRILAHYWFNEDHHADRTGEFCLRNVRINQATWISLNPLSAKILVLRLENA